MRPDVSHLKIIMNQFLLLVEEVLHHLGCTGCTKPCKSWDNIPINWLPPDWFAIDEIGIDVPHPVCPNDLGEFFGKETFVSF